MQSFLVMQCFIYNDIIQSTTGAGGSTGLARNAGLSLLVREHEEALEHGERVRVFLASEVLAALQHLACGYRGSSFKTQAISPNIPIIYEV